MRADRTRITTAVIAALFALNGCSTPRSTSVFGLTDLASAPNQGEAARVFATQCLPAVGEPLSPSVQPALPFIAPVLAALAGSLVEGGMNAVGNALVAAGTEQTVSIASLAATPSLDKLQEENSGNTCIHFVVGEFLDSTSRLRTTLVQERDSESGIATHRARLSSVGIFLARPARLHLEYRLVPNGTTPARMLRFVETSRVNNGLFGGGSAAERELAVMLLIAPGDGALTSAQRLQFPPERINVSGHRWFSRLDISAAPTSQWLPLTEDLLKKPVNIIFVVAQTRSANQFLTVIGNSLKSATVVDAAKTAVTTATRQQLDSAARQEAAIQVQTTTRSQLDQALTLAEEARLAIADAQACTEPCPIKTLKAREYAAIARARFSTLGMPVPTLDTSSLR